MSELSQRSIVIGTAGHIDHGKTMLVRALTGVDTDRLPEERRRGITVDLGFATLDLADANGVPLRVDLIDVPGHKQFIRNMLAGAAGIDAVMLIISAQEGVMPQTEEHLLICSLLGITRGIVVLTKCDLVGAEELSDVCERVRHALHHSFLSHAPIVPVSAHTGSGLDALHKALAQLAWSIPMRSASGLPRLPLDRSFVVKGFGTVVTGTLQSGSLSTGQTLRLEPGGREVRVRGLQRQGRSCSEAFAGSRVALNLTGVEVGEVRRGATLVLPKTLHAAHIVDAEISLLPGLAEFPQRSRVRLHSFTSESVATVSSYAPQAGSPEASRIVRLKLTSSVLLVPGDRFVLRRLSPAETIGGGRVLDAHPLPRTSRKSARAWLAQMREASPSERLQLRVDRRGAAGISIVQLGEEMGWAADAILPALQPMVASGSIRLLSQRHLVSQSGLQDACEALLRLLPDTGLKTTRTAGVRRGELRSHSRLTGEIFDAALEMLAVERRIVVRGESGQEFVYRADAVLDAPDPQQRFVAALAELYRRTALNPPLFADVLRELRLTEKDARSCVTCLLRDKTLVKIAAADIFMHRAAVEGLERSIRALKGQTLEVARLKAMTGLSRKYAMPLLEYLDRQRITRREGNTRIVL